MEYKMFGDIFCHKTLEQMRSAMEMPFVLQGALMPDAHAGYALPIGGVVKTKPGFVVPAWVGYDIGCGMTAAALDMPELSKEQLEAIRDKILEKIPVGNNKHKQGHTYDYGFTPLGKKIATSRGAGQLGTLGGGNHFIEMGKDEYGHTWVCIHSGSRGVGHAIGTHYMKVAAEKAGATSGNVEWHYPLTSDMQEYHDYLKDMNAALGWSVMNRATMLEKVVEAIREVAPGLVTFVADPIVNNHNMAEVLEDGILHRKGATPAGESQLGIIPGNMRDGFFFVIGQGCEESLNSASHGAGRVMSRGEAKQKVDFDEFKEEMKDIVTNISKETLDEAPAAYKSIFDVMVSQDKCVKIVSYIQPIMNVKG